MQNVREKLRMFSVNQMAAYHTLLEGYNIMRNSSSELIKTKWTKFNEMNCRLRSQTNNELKVPEKPKHKCTGFTYIGSKLYNMVPKNIRETQNPTNFKTLTKKWIWETIPSY